MTTNEKIAEFCGLKKDFSPDYENDLNAIHSAENYLLAYDGGKYTGHLYAHFLGDITLNDNGRGWEPLCNDDCFPILHATAKQRAEAFVKTINAIQEHQLPHRQRV